MKNLKIMNKLFILFIASSMIPLMIFAFITERSIETSMMAEIQKSNEIYATLTKENLTSFFEERKGDGVVQASNKDLIYYMKNRNNGKIDFQESITKSRNIKSQLKIMAEQYDYSDVFITDETGKVILQGVNGALMGFDMKDRDYMKKSLGGEQTWSELFFSQYYNTNIMVLSTPIKDGAEVIGTFNFFIDQAILDRLVQEGVEKIGKSGDAYLINKDMMLLTNTKLGMYKENSVLDESKKIETEMGKSISANINNIDFEEAKTYSDYLGNTVLGVGRVIKFGEGDAGLIIEVDKSEAFKKVEDMKMFFIIFTGLMIIIGAVIAVLIARTITRPLKKILERFTKISELDLSQKVPEELQDRKDEIGDIAKSMSLVQKNIREAIAITGEASQQLAASSEELTAICSETAEVSESFSHNVTSISEGAVDQAGSIEKGTKVTEDIGNLIDTNTDKLSQLNGVSEKMTREVNEGKETINTLIKMTEKNGQVANEIGAVIENTNRSAERIGEASKLISSIADQTNLLALNAAIESARAGEAGRGFSVVADEIRKLAEQSSESTLVIEKMLSELLENVIAAVDGIFVVKNTVDEQIQAVKVTEEKYAEIEESIKITIDELKDLIENGYVIEEKKDMVMNIMRSLTEIAEENVSSTEQAHAATEEQVASLNNIAESATALSELSEELQGSFAKFKL